MKLVTVAPISVVVEFNATDCLVLADLLETALYNDHAPDRALTGAMQAAFLGFAVLAAHDTITDSKEPERQMIAHARRVWGRPWPPKGEVSPE